MNYCPKCGKPLTENATFCMNCGAKVDVPPVEPSSAAVSTPKKRTIPLPAIILIVVVIIAFGFAKLYPTIQVYRISGTYEQPPLLDGYDGSTIQLNPDMTATYSLLGTINSDGYWTYDNGEIVLTTSFYTSTQEDTYTLYKNYLVDTDYIFEGSIPGEERFNATVALKDNSHSYNFSSDGTATSFYDGKTYKYTYVRDKNLITMTSNSGNETKFLILKDGIGSVYFTKQ